MTSDHKLARETYKLMDVPKVLELECTIDEGRHKTHGKQPQQIACPVAPRGITGTGRKMVLGRFKIKLCTFCINVPYEGIATRRGIMNAHQEPPYQSANWSLPNSELCRDNAILLPLFSGIGMDNLQYISDAIHKAMVPMT